MRGQTCSAAAARLRPCRPPARSRGYAVAAAAARRRVSRLRSRRGAVGPIFELMSKCLPHFVADVGSPLWRLRRHLLTWWGGDFLKCLVAGGVRPATRAWDFDVCDRPSPQILLS